MLRKPARESIFAAGMVRMVYQGKENGMHTILAAKIDSRDKPVYDSKNQAQLPYTAARPDSTEKYIRSFGVCLNPNKTHPSTFRKPYTVLTVW